MIPESAGATPVGTFQLADAFRLAATAARAAPRLATSGPARLLAYHSCELFLKCFLRDRGQDVETLRAYGHDLGAILSTARGHGLRPSPQIVAQLRKVAEKNDYVRVRYMVVERPSDLPVEKVIRLADSVRECVRKALNYDEFGNPDRQPVQGGQANHASRPLREPVNSAIKSR